MQSFIILIIVILAILLCYFIFTTDNTKNNAEQDYYERTNQFHSSNEQSNNATRQQQAQGQSNIYLESTINRTNEERIAALHREATQHKFKDWNRAIACLREADALVPTVNISYPIAHFLRLPLFLQQSGEFDAAMYEFNRLLEQTKERMAHELPHQSKKVRNMIANSEYAQIYKSMSTICSLEMREEQAKKFWKLYKTHEAKHKKAFNAEISMEKEEAKKRNKVRS